MIPQRYIPELGRVLIGLELQAFESGQLKPQKPILFPKIRNPHKNPQNTEALRKTLQGRKQNVKMPCCGGKKKTEASEQRNST